MIHQYGLKHKNPDSPERFGVEPVHRGDIGRACQQHVDLHEMFERRAGLSQHIADVGDDVGELRLEIIRQCAIGIETGNPRQEQ